jgi:hypothetical protein
MAETARFASPRGVNPQGIDVVDLDSERARLVRNTGYAAQICALGLPAVLILTCRTYN